MNSIEPWMARINWHRLSTVFIYIRAKARHRQVDAPDVRTPLIQLLFLIDGDKDKLTPDSLGSTSIKVLISNRITSCLLRFFNGEGRWTAWAHQLSGVGSLPQRTARDMWLGDNGLAGVGWWWTDGDPRDIALFQQSNIRRRSESISRYEQIRLNRWYPQRKNVRKGCR
jgi:hypothetical protein